MSDTAQAGDETTADQTAGLMLPGFISRSAQGISVDLSCLDSNQSVIKLVDRLFAHGLLLRGLDYANFHKLLYEYDEETIERVLRQFNQAGKPPEVFLASGIEPFPESRRPLYRGFKVDARGEVADYFFEPLLIDKVVEEPIYGEPDAAGNRPLIETRRREISEPVRLDFDEFVAAAWAQGLRFGLDAAAIRAGIEKTRPERMTIAHMRPPTPGQDASLLEQTDALYRNDAPRILPNGRIDLCTFSNRFPQVKAGTRLMKKIRRTLGRNGWDVAGQVLEPDLPKDFDMQALAGPGTRIESSAEGEFIVATIDGFLNLDTETSQLSVTEKIVNKEGVSLRTTGDVSFQCDEYEEHGEVQEGREVKGRHMTFLNNVFGHVVSDGGRITIKSNLAAGSAKSPGGQIRIEGNCSRAVLEAKGGEIDLNYVDSSLIIGAKVRIRHAISCDIYADEVQIELAEGCAIAARRVQIDMSRAKRGIETLVNILVPDPGLFDEELAQLNQAKSEAIDTIKAKSEETQALASQPALKTFLHVQQKLKAGEISLTPEQKADFQRLQAKVVQPLQQLQIARQQLQANRKRLEEVEREIEQLQQRHAALSAEVGCTLRAVDGETVVRTLVPQPNAIPLDDLPPGQLRARLREAAPGEKLFANDSGGFAWQLADAT
ncbi:MAG: flagellar assembly protein A [Pseudomonadota bacterium]